MRIVMYSGGCLSWAAAMRTIEHHGRDNVRLLFTDTKMEDEDLYRFLDESEKQLGVELIRIADGRNPWQVFKDRRMIGNTRVDPCSDQLKRKLGQKWLFDNYPPPWDDETKAWGKSDATLVFGIDWTETHRRPALEGRYAEMGYKVECPMMDTPWKTKDGVLDWMRSEGLEPPRLYAMGFAHNNCGGFCIRAGQGHFARLLQEMPERYRKHENSEQELRDFLGKDVAILRNRRGGITRPMTLRAFRQRLEDGEEHDELEIGGCGCFLEPVE